VTYKRYESYKDSGVEWIGEIPESWDMKKSKYFVNILGGHAPEGLEECEDFLEGVYYFKVDDLNQNNGTLFVSQSNMIVSRKGIRIIYPDLILIPKRGAAIYTNKVKISNVKCIFDSNVMGIKVSKINIKFFAYYIFSRKLNDIADVSTIPQINNKQINNLYITNPSFNEQKSIASFLDKKTAEIDSLIADKEKLIELLKEKRQAIISEAVTKGLDKNVKMKDSGVEWIGEIPEHWEVYPLYRNLFECKVKNTGNIEDNVLSLSYGRIIRRNVESNFGLLPDSFETYQIVESNNIILRLTDLQNDKRSLRCGLVKERGIITSAYVGLENKDDINMTFIYYLLHSYDVQKIFYGLGNGVRQSMTFVDLKRLPIVFPTKKEQNLIADYLDKTIFDFDRLINETESLISKLKEYRQSLIYEAVTGKIDVREEAV